MDMMPPQKKYIPTELLEKILLKLSVKSLTRFSTVLKSWNSTIHARVFTKRYRGREMIVMKPCSDPDAALVSPLSSILSCNPTANSPLPLPISRVRASCGELWCVEFEDGSVCLYNPSTRARRKLPASLSSSGRHTYGLGYDTATDDYKVLKFDRDYTGMNPELYSQRSESWRRLSDSSMSLITSLDYMELSSGKGGVFVNGLLHWIFIRRERWDGFTILSFDLSTEKCANVAWPEGDDAKLGLDLVDLGALRGKLCVYSDDRKGRGVMWVRDEGGLWSKEVVIYYYSDLLRTKEDVINYSHIFPENRTDHWKVKKTMCSDRIASIKAFVAPTHIPKIFLYEEEYSTHDFGCTILDCFTYVETMIKP